MATDRYIEFIRSCCQLNPDALGYYHQLSWFLADENENVNTDSVSLDAFDIVSSSENSPQSSQHSPFPFIPRPLDGPRENPMLVFIEGLPSGRIIKSLGSAFSIRPEFFIGHLRLEKRLQQPKPFYELPTIPSKRENILHIPFISIVRNHWVATPETPIYQARSETSNNCQTYEREILNERRYGYTRVRQVNVHSDQICSYEQLISINISRQQSPSPQWQAVFLLDQGRFINNNNFPWSTYDTGGAPSAKRPLGTVPIIPYNSLDHLLSTANGQIGDTKIKDLDKFHPLRAFQLMDETDAILLRTDPYFLIFRVLTMSVLSWNSLLNVIAEDLAANLSPSGDHVDDVMRQLQFNAELIDRVQAFISETQTIMQLPNDSSLNLLHPECDRLLARKAHIHSTLSADLSMLQTRCDRLFSQCQSLITLVVSVSQLRESKRAIDQAKQVGFLTQLAFIFVPANFIAAIFSMSVSELSNPPSIWVFFLSATLVSASAWALVSWEAIKKYLCQLKFHLPRRPRVNK